MVPRKRPNRTRSRPVLRQLVSLPPMDYALQWPMVVRRSCCRCVGPHGQNADAVLTRCAVGITVGAVVVPQGMAYATLAGLPPQFGLYSSFMGVLVYWFFATSKDITIGVCAGAFASPPQTRPVADLRAASGSRVHDHGEHSCGSGHHQSHGPRPCRRLSACRHLRFDHHLCRSPSSRLDCGLHSLGGHFCIHDRLCPQHCVRSDPDDAGSIGVLNQRLNLPRYHPHAAIPAQM